jgi:hypothetical protein
VLAEEAEVQRAIGPVARQRVVGEGAPGVRQTQRQEIATPEGEAERAAVEAERDAVSADRRASLARVEAAAETSGVGAAEVRDRLAEDLAAADDRLAGVTQEVREDIKSTMIEREEQSQRAQAEIEPNRWWKDASVGQRIGAVVGEALGVAAAVGRGMLGNLEQIKGNIQRLREDDIALQQQEIENARAAGMQADNALSQLQSMLGSDIAAEQVLREGMRQTALTELESISEGLEDVGQLETIRQTMADLEGEDLDRRIREIEREHGVTTETRQERVGQRVVGGMSPQQRRVAERIRERQGQRGEEASRLRIVAGTEEIKREGERAEQRVESIVPGFALRQGAAPPSATDLRGFRENVAAQRDFERSAQEFKSLLQQAGIVDRLSPIPTETRRQLEAVRGRMQLAAQAMVKGPASDSEAALAAASVGTMDTGGLIDMLTNESAAVDNAIRNSREGIRTTADVLGFSPEGDSREGGAPQPPASARRVGGR